MPNNAFRGDSLVFQSNRIRHAQESNFFLDSQPVSVLPAARLLEEPAKKKRGGHPLRLKYIGRHILLRQGPSLN